MLYLAAAVVLVGLLALLNLVLTFGVIRRLREHTAMLSSSSQMPALMRPVGEHAEEFVATTTEGDLVSRETLVGRTLVAFLSSTCQPCRERMPEFIELAAGFDGGRDQVLAVVGSTGGDDPTAREYAERLGAVARVVVEPERGPVATAFGVNGFPAFGVVGERGRIAVTSIELAELAVPAPA